jgi:hypothetical protein
VQSLAHRDVSILPVCVGCRGEGEGEREEEGREAYGLHCKYKEREKEDNNSPCVYQYDYEVTNEFLFTHEIVNDSCVMRVECSSGQWRQGIMLAE